MGCFLACFGSLKDRRKPRSQIKNKVLPRHQQRHEIQRPPQSTLYIEQEISAKPTNLISGVPYKLEEQLSLSTRKKVTFDTNVKAYEPVSVHESAESLPDNDKDVEKQKGDSSGKSGLSYSQSEDDSTNSSVRSYPPNHRTEMLSTQAFMEEEEVKKTGSNRNARDRSVYVHPVLNPVENLAQWKAVKSKGPPQPLNPQKENLKLEQEAPRSSFSSEPILKHPSFSFKSKSDQPKRENQEIAVDASLSNWLVTSETTPTKKTRPSGLEPISQEQSISQGSNSVVSLDDRPILGALTVEEIKQFSASNSPRRSPSRSPDEMAIIGTVGTYWKHKEGGNDSGSFSSYKGIPNTTSKYREDKKVNWHSTPFETRLERALNRRQPADA
ncbi:hypothetical protein RHSIM_Rhsim13G0039200 [Rhododendron simsii]|uniref:Uncharacterized protein n=1 Tax=Rhododendron simsii TaxID=118357 RepID=A0A834L788_RHOSS|nr:hypothetical protein RHSIM_Rhsim13G0039200 [Rhododendron simsii]